MTIMNEAARLFFAVSALILVGMLAGSEQPAMVSPLGAQFNTQIFQGSHVAGQDAKAQLYQKSNFKIGDHKSIRIIRKISRR